MVPWKLEKEEETVRENIDFDKTKEKNQASKIIEPKHDKTYKIN